MDFLKKVNEFLPLITAVGILLFYYMMYRTREVMKKDMTEMNSQLKKEIFLRIDLKFAEYKIDNLEKSEAKQQKKIDELQVVRKKHGK